MLSSTVLMHLRVYCDSCNVFQCNHFNHLSILFLFSWWDFSGMVRIDEKPSDLWDLPRVAVDALGAAMLVTIILDLWRIFLGPIVPLPETKQCLQPGLPWLPKQTNQTWSMLVKIRSFHSWSLLMIAYCTYFDFYISNIDWKCYLLDSCCSEVV